MYLLKIRDWALFPGRGGGLQNVRGGHVKFTLMKRGGGGRTSFSHAEGGGDAKGFTL